MFVSKTNFFKFVFAVIGLVSVTEGFALDLKIDLDETTQSTSFMMPTGAGCRAGRRGARRQDRRDDYQTSKIKYIGCH